MTGRRDERGSAIVEAPMAICIVLLLTMGAITLVQMTFTHLSLSSAVESATRYATHTDYDPTLGTGDRRRTDEQVRRWAVEVAEEANVDPDDVTITGRRVPSGEEVPIDQLVAGDEIVVSIATEVSNPLYRVAASITNTASHIVGAGDVFEPEGVGIRAEAVTYVE